MIDWRDQGVILSVRRHGEANVILTALTAEHGLQAGVVRGGASRKQAPVLQPGNQVDLEWRARLEEHLGSFRAEPLQSRSALLSDRGALSALASVTGLLAFALPERMPLPSLYEESVALLDRLSSPGWAVDYALWELLLLEELGYGLDLSACAATGGDDDLIYVSPKSGRAVSRAGGKDWADRLLPLPAFWLDDQAPDVIASLRTTGYFLTTQLAANLGDRPLPEARARLVAYLTKQEAKHG